jgi:uncharacterized protein YndB with AHSA1/START domain
MPTQKVFKQRVRARMARTGESYTSARGQLLRKASDADPDHETGLDLASPVPPSPDPVEPPSAAPDPSLFGVPDESMIQRTGRSHLEWFVLLDDWGATGHTHTEIARWLSTAHGVPGWWTQSVTVSYERARGMRARHQMANGYSVSATRSVGAEVDRVLTAFTEPALRESWLPAAPLSQRPTRAARTARFDWHDPVSRLVVTVTPRDGGKVAVTVTHEQIKEAGDAARLKAGWRGWLDDLRAFVEQG